MPLMNLYEPLFLLLALATLVSLVTAAVFAITNRRDRAGRLVRRVGAGAAIYFAVAIVYSIVSPRRTFRLGEPQCFDDWCITVASAARAAGTYDVALRLTNRARRVPMGEKGTVVYLTDGYGHRYDPVPRSSDLPLDTRLQPGQSAAALRHFQLPPQATNVALVFAHEGGFPIGWFVISEGGWFARPALMRLN